MHNTPRMNPIELPTELVDDILSAAVLVISEPVHLDVERYQSNIVAVVNVLNRNPLRKTHDTALVKMPWVMDLDLLCSKQHPLELLKWVHSVATRFRPTLYLHWTHEVIASASGNGDLAVLEWLCQTFGERVILCYPHSAALSASKHGHVHALDWWWNKVGERLLKKSTNRPQDVVLVAAEHGHIHVFEWWLGRGLQIKEWSPQDSTILRRAIAGKQVQFASWVEKHGYAYFDYWCAIEAVKGGDLAVLEYVMDRYEADMSTRIRTPDEVEWDHDTYRSMQLQAAEENHFHVLEWLVAKHYPTEGNVEGIAECGSVEMLKWWMDRCEPSANVVARAFNWACGHLGMMQLLYSRFPSVIIKHVQKTRAPDQLRRLLPTDEKEVQAGMDFRVLEWWETTFWKWSGVPKWKWPKMFKIQFIVGACYQGNVEALEWMLSSDPQHFVLECSRHESDATSWDHPEGTFRCDGRNETCVFTAMGEGGNIEVIEWWFKHRFQLTDHDIGRILNGAINNGHLHLLEWFSQQASLLPCFRIFTQRLLFVVDRALTQGHGHTLTWLLQHVGNAFTHTEKCFTTVRKRRYREPEPLGSNRATFQALTCYVQLVVPYTVPSRFPEINEICKQLVKCDRTWVIAHMIELGYWRQSDIEFGTIEYAVQEGRLSFVDWWWTNSADWYQKKHWKSLLTAAKMSGKEAISLLLNSGQAQH